MSYTKLTCSQCEKEFTRETKDVKSALNKKCKNVFCSTECMKQNRSKEVRVKCSNCLRLFLKKLSQIKHNANHYCSRGCYQDCR